MRNVLLFLDDKLLNDESLETIRVSVNQDDKLTVFYELPYANNTAVPLIGDLAEIRLQKATRLVLNWVEPITDSVHSYETNISFNINKEEIQKKLEDTRPTLFMGSKSLVDRLSKLFATNGYAKHIKTYYL